ncbi:hypothetical protein Trydic_g5953 [Trypoxylus dichotomus]
MARQLLITGIILIFFGCFVQGRTPTQTFQRSIDTLQLLHVVFRHGDRTQDGTYPNDPHQNYTYYPVGVGQLTNPGKIREFNIGTYLRSTYNDFLTDTYFPGILAANASSYPRCRASMELVLAGLYPPSPIGKWSNELNWQPIPYDYTAIPNDLLFWSTTVCSKYNNFLGQYMNNPGYQAIYEPYSDVLDYLQLHSGIPSKTYIALMLYSTLKSQQEWGLTLPEWAANVWPQPISDITQLDWRQMYPTLETRAIGGGFLMSKIIRDSQSKINGDPSVQNTRIYLYGGHDSNIAAVLSWLGTIDLHIPQYGSYVIIEVHKFLGIPFLRIIHQNYEQGEPQVIEIPQCGYYCPLIHHSAQGLNLHETGPVLRIDPNSGK